MSYRPFYRYIVIEAEHRFPEDAIRVQATPDSGICKGPDSLGEMAARHWFHPGTVGDWPLTFEIYQDDRDEKIGRFVVDMEMKPSFTVKREPDARRDP